MITECKYTIREVLKSLEDYIEDLDNVKDIEYWTRLKIKRNLTRMVNNTREYLGLDVKEPKKKSIGELVKDNMKYFT